MWVPSENRFAIVLIRGGDSFDPTRYTEDETYFEYGCDGADGIFCDMGYFNPDMLLRLPEKYNGIKKLPPSFSLREWRISALRRTSALKWLDIPVMRKRADDALRTAYSTGL